MSDQNLHHTQDTAGAAGPAGRAERQEGLGRKTRQVTVKGVEDEIFGLAQEAARKSGLRISAWIRMQLKEAAERVLNEQPNGPIIHPDVLAKISEQLREINQEQRAEKERIERMRDEINDIIKAQHGMMSKLLAAE